MCKKGFRGYSPNKNLSIKRASAHINIPRDSPVNFHENQMDSLVGLSDNRSWTYGRMYGRTYVRKDNIRQGIQCFLYQLITV